MDSTNCENSPVIYIAPFDESTGGYNWVETALDILILILGIAAAFFIGWLLAAIIGFLSVAIGGMAGLTAFTVKTTALIKNTTSLVLAAKSLAVALA